MRDIDFYRFSETLNYNNKSGNNHFLLSVIDYSNLLAFLIYFLGRGQV